VERRSTQNAQNTLSTRRARSIVFVRILRLSILVAAAFLWTRPAAAPPVPFSYLDLRIKADAIDGCLVVHIFDAAHDLNIDPPERLLDAALAGKESAALARMLGDRFQVIADGR